MASEGSEFVQRKVQLEQLFGQRFCLVILLTIVLEQHEAHLLQVATDVITQLQQQQQTASSNAYRKT